MLFIYSEPSWRSSMVAEQPTTFATTNRWPFQAPPRSARVSFPHTAPVLFGSCFALLPAWPPSSLPIPTHREPRPRSSLPIRAASIQSRLITSPAANRRSLDQSTRALGNNLQHGTTGQPQILVASLSDSFWHKSCQAPTRRRGTTNDLIACSTHPNQLDMPCGDLQGTSSRLQSSVPPYDSIPFLTTNA